VITARDRKIILTLIPLILVVGYWFMVLAPKRAESQKVSQQLTQAQESRDTAQQQVTQLNGAKSTFPSDYATVVRLGKAVPTTLDMPSLLVQLDRAARGTGIEIDDFKPGTAADAASGASAGVSSSTTSTPPGGGGNPAAPGAAPAQGFPAKQAQKAGQGVQQANDTNQANADKTAATGAQAPAGGASTGSPGLVAVPLTFTTTGSYFGLADFLHRMKRFVRVVNDQIVVRGRLMTIESFSFEKTGPDTTLLKADVTATIYLSPADQGATAGASAQGPGTASGASATSTAPSSSPTSTSPTSPTPTAVATP
jgi:Tfp pilus assembly protein PilO